MTRSHKTLVILAAGVGRRFGSLKQLVPVGPGDEAIMDFTVHDALHAGFDRVVMVIRRSIEGVVRKHVASGFGRRVDVAYVFQDEHFPPADAGRKPWGTAHAVLAACSEAGDRFAVANADDLYGRDAIGVAGRYLDEVADPGRPTWALVGYPAETTLPPRGGVSRGVLRTDAGWLRSIDEIPAMTRHVDGVAWTEGERTLTVDGATPVSMNLWAFTGAIAPLLGPHFERFLADGPGGDDELLLPVVVGALVDAGEARVQVRDTSSSWCGVTAATDLEWVRGRVTEQIAAGQYPARLWQ